MVWGPFYFSVQLDITNACNLRCSHCYHSHHRNVGALSLEDWFEVIAKIERFARRTRMSPKLILCGGEPLTSPHLLPIAQSWIERFPQGMRAVLTNGTLLKKPMPGTGSVDYALGLHRLGFQFQISIDGPDEASHDRVRGPGNFRRAIEAVRRLNEIGARYNILAVLNRDSASRIPDFFTLAVREKFLRMDFERMVSLGQATGEKSGSLKGVELRIAYERILQASRNTGVATSTKGPLWAAIEPGLGSADTLGFYDWIVGYRGDLKISSRTDHRIGHVLRDDPEKLLFNDSTLRALRARKIEGCGDCDYFKRGDCSGNRNIAYAETGSFLSVDPGCWVPGEIEREHVSKNKGYFNWLTRFNGSRVRRVEDAAV